MLENEKGPSPADKGLPAPDLFAKVAQWEARFPTLATIREEVIVGQAKSTLHLLRDILLFAPGKDPVLIQGETGTGKTGVAEALWRLGPRAQGPFRAVNCAELASADPALTLGKLFGFGAGAGLAHVPAKGQSGLLEDLDGGTLFLDEIHQLPAQAQAMLLLPLEGRPFNPAAGKGDPKTVDVKFIFATNVDLAAAASSGDFPADLYQRLAACRIRVPPLRERQADIARLARHFVAECESEFGLDGAEISPALIRWLNAQPWEGNIRQLRTAMRDLVRRAAFEMDGTLSPEHLPEGAMAAMPAKSPGTASVSAPTPTAASSADAYDPIWNGPEADKLNALRNVRFKIAAAEKALGLSSKSKTLTHHLRGLCFKALCATDHDLDRAARAVVGKDDQALLDRMRDRMEGYLNTARRHLAAHTTTRLYANLPRDYRRNVEEVLERLRAEGPAG
jgi:transcriptional regulator with AAA-type ATPase domain